MIARSQMAPVSPAALIISMPDGPATLQSVKKKAQDKRAFRLLVFLFLKKKKKNVAPHQNFNVWQKNIYVCSY